MGEALTHAQLAYLRSHRPTPLPAQLPPSAAVPSLAELGAFSALGLDIDAREEEVREAHRLLTSIHSSDSEPTQPSETLLRLDEAFRVAMGALAHRVRPGVTEVGR